MEAMCEKRNNLLHLYSRCFLVLGCEQLSVLHFVWVLTLIITNKSHHRFPVDFNIFAQFLDATSRVSLDPL